MKKFLALFLVTIVLLALPLYSLAEAAATEPAALIDLTPLLQAIIGVAAALVTTYVIPWLRRKKLMDYARIAVYAAEKLLGPKMGPDKLAKAKEYMARLGYNVDTEKVQMALEAACQQLEMEQSKPGALLQTVNVEQIKPIS